MLKVLWNCQKWMSSLFTLSLSRNSSCRPTMPNCPAARFMDLWPCLLYLPTLYVTRVKFCRLNCIFLLFWKMFLDLNANQLVVPERVKRTKMLGRGAFGFVFKASVMFRGHNSSTDVALKMLQPVDPGFSAKQSALCAFKVSILWIGIRTSIHTKRATCRPPGPNGNEIQYSTLVELTQQLDRSLQCCWPWSIPILSLCWACARNLWRSLSAWRRAVLWTLCFKTTVAAVLIWTWQFCKKQQLKYFQWISLGRGTFRAF